MPEQHVQTQFTVEADPTVTAAVPVGSITIRGADTHIIDVSVTKRGSEDQIERTQVDIGQDGNEIYARVRGQGNLASVDLEIQVPETCTVHAEAASASLDITGVAGSVKAGSASGMVILREVAGEIRLHTASGNVDASDLRGSLTFNTASGDAMVHDSQLSSFTVHSASGNVTLETPLHEGQRSTIKTASGDGTLIVPADTHAEFVLHSASGTIESDAFDDRVERRVGTSTLRLGSGGAQIEMMTASGTLRVLQSDPPQAIPAMSAMAAADTTSDRASGETATAVLAALERGEISVDDAMARLDRQA